MVAPVIPNAQSPLAVVLVDPLTGAPYANPGAVRNRVALLGDSNLSLGYATYNVPTSANSFVVAAGVGTIVAGQNCLATPGGKFYLNNFGDTTLSSALSGSYPTVLTAPSGTTFTFAATYNGRTLSNGDHSADFASQGWVFSTLQQETDTSVFTWLNRFNRGQLSVVSMFGNIGLLSSTLVAMLPNIFAGPVFDYAAIHIGTNDINSQTTLTSAIAGAVTALANTITIVSAVLSYGAIPIVFAPPFVGRFGGTGSQPSNRQLKNIALNQLRQGLIRYAAANRSVLLIDSLKDMADGTDVNGGYASGYGNTSDDIHSTPTAQIASARFNNSAWSLQRPPLDVQPVSRVDDASTLSQPTAPYANLIPHGMMDGAAGSLAGVATGTVSTGWGITASTGTVAAVSAQARAAVAASNAANWGLAQRITASGTNGQGYTFASGAALTSLIVPGTWYQWGVIVNVMANVANLGTLAPSLLFRPTGLLLDVILGSSANSVDNTLPLLSGDSIPYVSKPFLCPSGAVFGQVNISIQVLFNGAGSADLQFCSAFMRQVDAP